MKAIDINKTIIMSKEGCISCGSTEKQACHGKLDSIMKLKNSTKKLLCLLEEIQTKTRTNGLPSDELKEISKMLQLKEKLKPTKLGSVTEILGAEALKRLENQTKELDAIEITDTEDDCTVYKKLTRKCHCLNQKEYNDFVIHFNEDTKFCTNAFGELIKNMRITKKFICIGGCYTKRALMFLNEGLSEATFTEKVEIIQAISFADLCGVFDEHTIVDMCLIWPNKNGNIVEPMTQELTASLLYKIVQVEEGRRYINFNSKIMFDIRRILRKKDLSNMDYDVIECLKSILAIFQPTPEQTNLSYYCRTTEEALGNRALNALNTYRNMMTMSEVFQYLDILHSHSNNDSGKLELSKNLPLILSLFKSMLIEYDNSGMNIIITNVLNNIITKTASKEPDLFSKTHMAADTATEPITMKNVVIQIPDKKNIKRNNINKSKLMLGTAQRKYHKGSKRRVNMELAKPDVNQNTTFNLNPGINRTKKFTARDVHHYPGVIVVPID